MSITQEIYDEEVYVKNINVAQLDARQSRARYIRYNLIGVFFIPIFLAAFFYISLSIVFPFVLNNKIFIGLTSIIFALGFFLLSSTFWHSENEKLAKAIMSLPCSFSMIIVCAAVIFKIPTTTNEIGTFIGMPFPWNGLMLLILISGYFWFILSLLKIFSLKNVLNKIITSNCIDQKRKLYFQDLENRNLNEEIKKPRAFDIISISLGTLLMPFIQVLIIKSNIDTSTSAIVSFIGSYLFALLFIFGFILSCSQYYAIRKIQQQLGIYLKGARARGIKFRITLFKR